MDSDGSTVPPTSDLVADVWEFQAEAWKVTHQFNSGLELDRLEKQAGADNDFGKRIHLPAASLHVLQRLRAALHVPDAILLDLKLKQPFGGHALAEAHGHLLDKLALSMSDLPLKSVQEQLGLRASPWTALPVTPPHFRRPLVRGRQQEDWDSQSALSEFFDMPEPGHEVVDISVCITPCLLKDKPSIVRLARLSVAVSQQSSTRAPVRYVVVILVPEGAHEAGSRLGEATATAFMDAGFAAAVNAATSMNLGSVFHALDSLLSRLTIVPTVRLGSTQPRRRGDRLLSDSIVGTAAQFLCESRGLNVGGSCGVSWAGANDLTSPSASGAKCFVEVDEYMQKRGLWHVTHQLRQGLELDATKQAGGARSGVHLPRVSVSALAELRQLMTASPAPPVALDVEAVRPLEAVNAALDLLRPQLSETALTEVASILLDRAIGSGLCNAQKLASVELMKPATEDEACHILAITCQGAMTEGQKCLHGAFVRFKAPLCCRLPSAANLARFMFVFVAPGTQQSLLSTLVDSFAALAIDEDLVSRWCEAGCVQDFIQAFDDCLDNLLVIPHARLQSKKTDDFRFTVDGDVVASGLEDLDATRQSGRCQRMLEVMEKYSIPLVSGVLLALLWSNVDHHSYQVVMDGSWFGDFKLLGHTLSLHFVANDVFMCFFFGLAIKEVTEALLPGGSLSPLRRAANPLIATIGGVAGPAVAYLAFVSILFAAGAFEGLVCTNAADDSSGGHRRLGVTAAYRSLGAAGDEPCDIGTLLKGWGVPTATDISLAWMFAVIIFGAGHPAINFLLLLAIVDDAIGMVIIAACYPDPKNPVEPVYLLLVLAAMVLSFVLRKLKVPCWSVYIGICGPLSWLGLLKAHVHPALALVFVVPFMPADEAVRLEVEGGSDRPDLGAVDWDGSGAADATNRCAMTTFDVGGIDQGLTIAKGENPPLMRLTTAEFPSRASSRASSKRSITSAYGALREEAKMHSKAAHHGVHSPLHALEYTLKTPVSFGMFFFGAANAGVSLDNVGALTVSVLFALIVGKTLGIAGCSLFAQCIGFQLPAGISNENVFALAALGGVGLTVALFVSNEAFVDPGLQGQAKFAAVLSVSSAAPAALISWMGSRRRSSMNKVVPCTILGKCSPVGKEQACISLDTNYCVAEYLDTKLTDEIARAFGVSCCMSPTPSKWLESKCKVPPSPMSPTETVSAPCSPAPAWPTCVYNVGTADTFNPPNQVPDR